MSPRRSGWRRKSEENTGRCKIQIEMLVYLDGNRYICSCVKIVTR